MQKIKNLFGLVLEGLTYGFFGGLFVFIVLEIEDYLKMSSFNDTRFSIDSNNQSLGVGCIFIGLSFSAILWNLSFGNIKKVALVKWFFIHLTSSITTVLIQMGFLIYFTDSTINEIITNDLLGYVWNLLGFRWIIKVFIILTPFTVLFANRHLLIEKVRQRNVLE